MSGGRPVPDAGSVGIKVTCSLGRRTLTRPSGDLSPRGEVTLDGAVGPGRGCALTGETFLPLVCVSERFRPLTRPSGDLSPRGEGNEQLRGRAWMRQHGATRTQRASTGGSSTSSTAGTLGECDSAGGAVPLPSPSRWPFRSGGCSAIGVFGACDSTSGADPVPPPSA
jgi:hypothetical protein